MKSHFNLFFLFLVSFLFVFSACKKEPGCMDPAAFNYNPDAKKDDGSCIPTVLGCMDETACNYDCAIGNQNSEVEFNITEHLLILLTRVVYLLMMLLKEHGT